MGYSKLSEAMMDWFQYCNYSLRLSVSPGSQNLQTTVINTPESSYYKGASSGNKARIKYIFANVTEQLEGWIKMTLVLKHQESLN